MEALPDSYRTLARWFPTLTARARAIGRSRETLTTWERNPARRVRRSTARAIDLVVGVAEEAERLIGDPRGAGEWMLAPQPAVRGATPAEFARAGRLAELRPLFQPEAVLPPVTRRISREQLRRADRAMVGRALPRAGMRERPRDPDEAEVLRRIGEREELIGPRER